MSSKPGTNACTRLAAGRSDTVIEEPNGGPVQRGRGEGRAPGPAGRTEVFTDTPHSAGAVGGVPGLRAER